MEQLASLKQNELFRAGFTQTAFNRIRKRLMDGTLSDEVLSRLLNTLANQINYAARVDEIARIRINTLDADFDVWSVDDEGNMLSLDERHETLKLVQGFAQSSLV